MKAIIQARELSRWYGIVMGLNNVSFEVPPGLTGLVGPNGAGKSTLLQIVTGQLQPSSGTLTVLGERPWNNPRLLGRIGFCPEHEAIPADLRPGDWLRALGLISGLSPAEIERRVEATLERVKLDRAHWGRLMGGYSKGMRQRVKLAQALLHEPELLVLDEPMNGLDPLGRQEMARLLRDLAGQGVHVLISSHILAELEPLCESILLLNWGRIVASGSQEQIRANLKHWPEALRVRCSDPARLARILVEDDLLLGFDLEPESGVLSLRVRQAEAFYERWAGRLLESGVAVYEIRRLDRSLRDLYDKVTA
jgi:ABC-2 type transport system ATP-binding protein